MPSNLLLGSPTIPLAATAALSSGTASTTYPLANLFGGNRTDRFELTAATGGSIQINLPLSAAASADFVYVGGAKRLLASGASFSFSSHTANNYALSTPVTLSTAFSSANLTGPHSEDFISTFTALSRQYWWAETSGASSNRTMDKMFLGSAFDIGRDPDEKGGVITRRLRPVGSQRRSAYEFDITWSGVSYANAVLFHTRFVRPRRFQPFILFTTTYHEVLCNSKVIFGRITQASTPPVATGVCDVTMTFQELV